MFQACCFITRNVILFCLLMDLFTFAFLNVYFSNGRAQFANDIKLLVPTLCLFFWKSVLHAALQTISEVFKPFGMDRIYF